jgi:hypothetical protein
VYVCRHHSLGYFPGKSGYDFPVYKARDKVILQTELRLRSGEDRRKDYRNQLGNKGLVLAVKRE